MMSDKDNLAETAEYYDTHDISADMQAGEWTRHEGKHAETAMSGFNTRLPTAVLNDARAIARARGMATGAWIREVIEAAVARQKAGNDMVPMSVLLAAGGGIPAAPGLLTRPLGGLPVPPGSCRVSPTALVTDSIGRPVRRAWAMFAPCFARMSRYHLTVSQIRRHQNARSRGQNGITWHYPVVDECKTADS